MLKVTYLEHSIPNISLSVLHENKLYYTDHNNSLFSFDFKTKVSTYIELLKDIYICDMVIFKNKLLILSGNKLMIYKQAEESLVYINSYMLEDIPSKIFCNSKGCIFLYGKSMEIFTDKLYKVKVLLEILDICENNNIYYVLTNTQDIYQCPNIFDAKDIIFSKPLIRNNKNEMKKIYYDDKSKTIILSNSEKTEKYDLKKHVMLLCYTLSYSGHLINGILCGKHAIEIGKAPFLLLIDELFDYKVYDTYSIGLSKSKIYFITTEKVESINNTELEGCYLEKIKINPNVIEIPSLLKSEDLINKYVELEVKLKKYEIISDKLYDISNIFEKRKEEILAIEVKLLNTEKGMVYKSKLLKERIELLEKKAMKISGDQNSINEFYEKVNKVKKMINNYNCINYDKYKKRILSQKYILESKLN